MFKKSEQFDMIWFYFILILILTFLMFSFSFFRKFWRRNFILPFNDEEGFNDHINWRIKCVCRE